MSWRFLAFVGFAMLVILHELGHFWAAKAVGMRVEKFSLFFPPTLFSVKRGETEYAIGAIPAGGYVKISGMNPSEDLPDEVRTRAYYSQPVWKRIVVIAAGPAMNLLLAFLLLFVFFWLIGPETGTARRGRRSSAATRPRQVLQPGDRARRRSTAAAGPRASCRSGSRRTSAPGRPTRGLQGGHSRRRSRSCATASERTFELTPIYDADAHRTGRPARATRLGFAYAPGPRETAALRRRRST